MKKLRPTLLLVLASFLLLQSCGSSFESFYQDHKYDQNATAVRFPKFLSSLLGNVSPEMGGVLRMVDDFRFLQLDKTTALQNSMIRQEVKAITQQRYTDLLRKNLEQEQYAVSVLNKGLVVKNILVQLSGEEKHTFLYLKGHFNPSDIKRLTAQNEFEGIINTLSSNPLP